MERDFTTHPMTREEQYLMLIAHMELYIHSLRSKAQSVLATRRSATGYQALVLASKADDLEQFLDERFPSINDIIPPTSSPTPDANTPPPTQDHNPACHDIHCPCGDPVHTD